MTLEYHTDKRVKDLVAVLDEYSGWFMQVLRCLSYPVDACPKSDLSEPVSYRAWIVDAEDNGLAPDLVKRLDELQADLHKQAMALVDVVREEKISPDYKSYDRLLTLFEEFAHHIRRLEVDMFLEDSGLDALTGLRSQSVFKDDIQREMDRLARQGKQFSLALVRVDGLDGMKEANDEATVRENLQSLAGMIRRSVRSFDDAYRLESDEFLLALKQADMSGGIRAMERLKKELEAKDVVYKIEGKEVFLSLSSCIAEPLPGDDVDDLLANLRADLDSSTKDDGAVLEYFEMSPLQRYAKQIQE